MWLSVLLHSFYQFFLVVWFIDLFNNMRIATKIEVVEQTISVILM
jgi:hypothetical protein